MKVLLAHNYYRSSAPSGEDAVFRNERALLEGRGIDVIPFEKFNDAIDDSTFGKRVRVALDTSWSKRTYREIVALIRSTRPDVAHFHNTFPQISPSAYLACRENGVPVVQTLHNFRYICPGAMLLRDNKPCELCVGTTLLPALRHRCYRGSLAATSALVWMIERNRRNGAFTRLVDCYIALSRFSAGRLIAGGLPAHKIEIKPNFIAEVPGSNDAKEHFAIYVGRLKNEKGVRTLLKAWRDVHHLPLKIFGDGELRDELTTYAATNSLNVEFMGFRPRAEIMVQVARAKIQIVPSECYEGFPLVVLEAYACGTPIIASRIGSLDELVSDHQTGIKFEAGNAINLAATVNELVANTSSLETMGSNVRNVVLSRYTAEQNYVQLLGIYGRARVEFESNQMQGSGDTRLSF